MSKEGEIHNHRNELIRSLKQTKLNPHVNQSRYELDRLPEPTKAELAEMEKLEASLPFSQEEALMNLAGSDPTNYYLNHDRQPLLTREAETELFHTIKVGKSKRTEIVNKHLSNNRSLTPTEKAELREVVGREKAAIDTIVKANQGLVVKVAKIFANRSVSFLDLIQEGNIGLIRAIKNFDYTKGFKFSTYATWWIRQAVGIALNKQMGTIRIPGDQRRQMVAYLRQQNLTPVANNNQQLPKNLRLAINADGIRSLNEPTSTEDGSGSEEMGELIEDPTVDVPSTAELKILREILQKILDQIDPKAARLLSLRYGLKDGSYNLPELGKKFGVSRQRAQKIQEEALLILKTIANRSGKKYTDFLK